ncbi:ninjurin-1-like [Babylonia areolata]|uniref:ninjurin-1-like n=1 Tax=Babylonia areolata TaxID=304850 RepID=UPI003FD1567A
MAASIVKIQQSEADQTIELRGTKDEAGGKRLQSAATSDKPDGDEVFTDVPFMPLLSHNQYTVRKMAAQAMMDVALMMANISQLRTLLAGGSTNITYFYILLSLVIFSLVSQLVFGILIFIIWVRESSAHQREEFQRSMREKEFRSVGDASPDAVVKVRLSMMRQRENYRHDLTTNHLNHVTMVLVFLITVTNMFITGFGIEPPSEWDSSPETNSTPT